MREEKILQIGFQGERGAYSEKAIETLFEEQLLEKVPFRTSYAVIDALKKNKIDFGLLPIENSIVGSITHNYDLLMENKLSISKEVIIPIRHSLLTLNGVNLQDIKKIYSHPAALAQCEVFLRRFEQADVFPTYDTAGSARMIKEKNLMDSAAIASSETAEVYGLQVLEESIEDYPHNRAYPALQPGLHPVYSQQSSSAVHSSYRGLACKKPPPHPKKAPPLLLQVRQQP